MAVRLELPTSGVRSYLYPRRADHFHRGIDLPAPEGTPIYAEVPGVVTHASNELAQGFSGYGRHVVIQSGPLHLLHAHLERAAVSPGQTVARGELLGTVGRTCFARATREDPQAPSRLCSGPHVHFEASARAYPQDSEAPRLDPVAVLEELGAHPFVPSSAPAWTPLPPPSSPEVPGPLPPPDLYTGPYPASPPPRASSAAAWLFGFGLLGVGVVALVRSRA